MSEDILSVHHPVSPRVSRDRLRMTGYIIFIFFLMLLVVLFASAYLDVKGKTKNGIMRSEKEMVTGGKRFLDYFYSLNSRSVEEDQFTAIAMIGDSDKARERTQYLARTDFIRNVQSAHIKSYIDWQSTKINILPQSADDEYSVPGTLKVEYKGKLHVEEQTIQRWHMVLFLAPSKITTKNPTGVAVKDYIDVSEQPLF